MKDINKTTHLVSEGSERSSRGLLGWFASNHVAANLLMFLIIIAGLLATIFAKLGNLSGLASEEAAFLSLSAKENIDFKGLVLAGMIIGVLGILDDITISQSSVVQQLKSTKKSIKFKRTRIYFIFIQI